jgi:hypothetical protein
VVPYTGQDHQAYKFSNGLLRYEVLLCNVPNLASLGNTDNLMYLL